MRHIELFCQLINLKEISFPLSINNNNFVKDPYFNKNYATYWKNICN